ncbi:T9SS type A sorting domain-containing protein [bacterium]|nr:T9SS type A sorting domain-containing protein [bacterium]
MFIALSLITFGQSISGSVESNTGSSLGYANVNIYQGDELVASVLTDKTGSFHVALDTGWYRCEIEYAGHVKETRNIHVTGDEKEEVAMEAGDDYEPRPDYGSGVTVTGSDVSYDAYAPDDYYDAESVRSTEAKAPSRGFAYSSSVKSSSRETTPIAGSQIGIEAGKLTAGEINDFSKWELWKDISNDELLQYQDIWGIKPLDRFSVQVTNQNGLPIANASVLLLNGDAELYRAVTDNTGKAELWGQLAIASASEKGNYRIEIKGKDFEETIKRPKSIDKGVNTISVEQDCYDLNKVDIAFVVDATGSMGDELEFLKAELNEVIFNSKKIDNKLLFRFANVFYRDQGDFYLTSSMDFTTVLSEAVRFVDGHSAGGGGDYEEAVESALDTAINKFNWSEDARARILFLVLDAPPHNTPEIKEQLLRLGEKAAAKGVRIVPIVASGINKSAEYLFRSLALATNGTYVFLTNHSGIGNEHMEPSTDEYKVELLSGLLERILVSYTYMPNCDQDIPELPIDIDQDSIQYTETSIDSTSSDSAIQVENTFSWKYYPNPSSGKLYVEVNQFVKELHITDMSGKLLQIIANIHPEEKRMVDLSSYSSGIYLIRYPHGKQWSSGKIILQR